MDCNPLVVIPIRDALEHVERCLCCLDVAQPALIVDDASREETAGYLDAWLVQYRENHPLSVRMLVRHQKPRGYAHALNTAAIIALQWGYDSVVAVNSDTVFRHTAPARLANAVDRWPFVGPALSTAGSGQMSDSALAHCLCTADLAHVERERACLESRNISEVNGAFFAFSVAAWCAAGPFDERFGLGAAEEADWMRRFPGGGLYMPSVCVIHAKHASYKDHPEIDSEAQWRRNNDELKRKEAAGEKWARMEYPREMPC